MNQKYHEFYRGEIYYADTNAIYRNGTGNMQPVLVLLTDQGLYDTPAVVVAEARRASRSPSQTTHVLLEDVGCLPGSVVFQLEKARPIDKRRLQGKAGRLTSGQMEMIDAALRSYFYLEEGGYLPMEVEAP